MYHVPRVIPPTYEDGEGPVPLILLSAFNQANAQNTGVRDQNHFAMRTSEGAYHCFMRAM